MNERVMTAGQIRLYGNLAPGDRYYYLGDTDMSIIGVPEKSVWVNRFITSHREWYEASTTIIDGGEPHIITHPASHESYRKAHQNGRSRHLYITPDLQPPPGTLSPSDEIALFLGHSYNEQCSGNSNHEVIDLDAPEPPDHPLRVCLFTYEDYVALRDNPPQLE